MPDPFLCIGGPLSGKQYATRNGAGWFRHIEMKVLFPVAIDFSPSTESVPLDEIIYERQSFYLDDAKPLHFWVPEGQTGTETMRLLCEAYSRENRRPTTPPEGGRG